jgi:hypothetical protein
MAAIFLSIYSYFRRQGIAEVTIRKSTLIKFSSLHPRVLFTYKISFLLNSQKLTSVFNGSNCNVNNFVSNWNMQTIKACNKGLFNNANQWNETLQIELVDRHL